MGQDAVDVAGSSYLLAGMSYVRPLPWESSMRVGFSFKPCLYHDALALMIFDSTAFKLLGKTLVVEVLGVIYKAFCQNWKEHNFISRVREAQRL